MSVYMGEAEAAYPTPRSSTDHSAWVRTPAPASNVQRGPAPVPHRVGATTPRTGLHTPVASLEITSPAPPSKVTSAAKSENDQRQLEKSANLRSQIDKLQLETNRSQRLAVDVATWEAFEANHRESVEYRTEYVADTETMIVTCASGVHESFRPLVRPFTDVANAFGDTYTIETNIDIRITSSSSRVRSNRVPDFVFAKRGVDPKNLFLLECAWSQNFKEVEEKADLSLTRNDVQLVACLDIGTKGQGLCLSPPRVNYKICDPDTFPTQPHRRFESVTFEDHCWAGAIDALQIHLFRRGFEVESYNIFPDFGECEVNQALVGLNLGKLLISQLEADSHSFFTAEKPFSIDWDGLYDNINKRLISDGFQRYKDWAIKVADDPSITAIPPVKLRRKRSEDLQALPAWFKSKKPKTENILD
ncbi:hypothetical protein B0H16DRAFT_1589316 [Mycena metata]|uniref:Uncharacterized protein n=1 Tax=Mycena metata TaxID=1033252 RepID=A0AAD7HTT2_9AGAR|nr:hypothetical protein B0H16DRAFT_1589316 [Mycena metata]